MTDFDPEIEAQLDRVGRDRAFARAQSYGWGGMAGAPPKWVWRSIIRELEPRVSGELTPEAKP